MEQDLVSIIVPVYNVENYLERCIKSIVNQTYNDIEVIFINDGSTDNSLEILNSYAKNDERIKIINSLNKGVSISRNEGIKNAKGRYICFIDADDYIDNKMIQKMKECIEEKKVDVIRINNYLLTLEGEILGEGLGNYGNRVIYKEKIRKELIPNLLSGKIKAFTPLLMIKKEKIKQLFNPEICFMEDTVFYINLMLNIDSIYFLDEPLYYYALNENGVTQNRKNALKRIESILLVEKEIENTLSINKIEDEEIYNVLWNSINTIIIYDIFIMYMDKQDISVIIKNQRIKETIEKGKSKQLQIHNRLAIKAIKRQSKIELKIIFFIKNIISRILKKINKN